MRAPSLPSPRAGKGRVGPYAHLVAIYTEICKSTANDQTTLAANRASSKIISSLRSAPPEHLAREPHVSEGRAAGVPVGKSHRPAGANWPPLRVRSCSPSTRPDAFRGIALRATLPPPYTGSEQIDHWRSRIWSVAQMGQAPRTPTWRAAPRGLFHAAVKAARNTPRGLPRRRHRLVISRGTGIWLDGRLTRSSNPPAASTTTRPP
jgi:hypothetical protein